VALLPVKACAHSGWINSCCLYHVYQGFLSSSGGAVKSFYSPLLDAVKIKIPPTLHLLYSIPAIVIYRHYVLVFYSTYQ
jgi:hypothetical protein